MAGRPLLLAVLMFKQLFAQVTNPPLDGIREELVTQYRDAPGPGRESIASDRGQLPPDQAQDPDPR
jgi:hypothetical protein